MFPGSLHNHTHYSNLRLRDAIVRETELLEYAGQLGHKVVAITEHESISNSIKLEKAYKKVYRNTKLSFKDEFDNDYMLSVVNVKFYKSGEYKRCMLSSKPAASSTK